MVYKQELNEIIEKATEERERVSGEEGRNEGSDTQSLEVPRRDEDQNEPEEELAIRIVREPDREKTGRKDYK